MNLHLKGLAALLLLFGFSPQAGYALTPVPTGLPAQQAAAFRLRFATLTELKTRINLRIDILEAKCASVVEGSSLEGECASAQAEIRVDKSHYKEQSDTYERELAAAIDTELSVINNRVSKTRNELETLTPHLLGFQASVDEWVNLADEAREKARHTAKETVVTLLLEKLSLNNEAEVKLDENALRRINVLLRKQVFMDDLYAQVLTVKKLQSLKTDLAVINLLKTIQATLVLHSAIESEHREETLKALLKGIEIACQDPRVALLVADGEITIDAAYGWLAYKYAGDRVNQLLDLGEARFKSVKVLTTLYKTDIDNRKTLLATRGK